MIRIGDHLFRLDLIRHIWVETDGEHFIVFVEIESDAKHEQWPFVVATRDIATDMINTIQSEIESIYIGGDDESYDVV
jgi:hypothetical protein